MRDLLPPLFLDRMAALLGGPESAEYRYEHARALQALGRHEEAAKALEKAAALQPMNPHAWYSLGMAYHTLRNQDKVRQIIDQLSGFDPKMQKRLMQDTGMQES